MSETTRPTVPRWLHGWAILTVCAALPLIALGAEVTTKQVGMADKEPLRHPLYLLLLARDELWVKGVGLVIEHSHRTAGWLVGVCSIVLAVGLWMRARGTGVRGVGLLALVVVSLQGILGYMRVRLDIFVGPEMAMVHGLFAQVAFATLVGVAVVTSRSWQGELPAGEIRGMRRIAAFLFVATASQIVFGALVRHQHGQLAQRAHALFAFIVVATIVVLIREVREATENRTIRRIANVMVALVIVQISLGVEAWLRRFGAGVPVEALQANPMTDLIRTAHYFVGALVFSSAGALNLLLYRPATTTALVRTGNRADVISSIGGVAAPIGGTL
jgi:cytochrome c oxidase assembly protein subunit 15